MYRTRKMKGTGVGDDEVLERLVDRQGVGLLFIASRAFGATLKVVIGIVTGAALLSASL